MKVNLRDVSFLILVRIDSIERLENICVVVNSLNHFFDTNIYVMEADKYNNKILYRMLKSKCKYIFHEDRDYVLHKTKLLNILTKYVFTEYVCLLDADIVIDKDAILTSVDMLRNQNLDVVYPYNGTCYNVQNVMRDIFMTHKSLRFLKNNTGKMDFLYNYRVVGGILILRYEKYNLIGKENEVHYGWGNDDYDRYARFKNNNLQIKMIDVPLFHLYHPKLKNSMYINYRYRDISEMELKKNKIFK